VPFPKCTVADALALALAARAGAGKALCALCLCCAAAAHRVRPQPMPLVRNRRMGRTMQSRAIIRLRCDELAALPRLPNGTVGARSHSLLAALHYSAFRQQRSEPPPIESAGVQVACAHLLL
jgi:hypothetical protein